MVERGWNTTLGVLGACTALLGCAGEVDVRERVDAGSGGGGSGGGEDEFADAAVCVAEGVEAEAAVLPVDILWVVDTSGSMSYETQAVEANLNAFAAQIDGWDIDYRVIMVAERGTGSREVCVPEPLGGADCGDGALYRHVPLSVGSHDALARLVEAYPAYQDFLRAETVKHIVVVSDDEADDDADDQWFGTQVATLTDPGFAPRQAAPDGFIFHSIVAWGDVPDVGCDTGADIGQSYLDLTELTDGVKAKVCEQDWTPIFEALQTAIVEGSQLPCAFELPEPPDDRDLDTDQVNVVYTPSGGAETVIPRVDSETECADGTGWFYDEPGNPTMIQVCPATCEAFEESTDGRVELRFGCTTVVK